MTDSPLPETSLVPTAGWHCAHLFYRFDRRAVRELSPNERTDGCREFTQTLDAEGGPGMPARLQTLIVSGHKADFGLVVLDPHPLVIDGLHQRLMSGPFGSALVPTWSMVSMTEVSEYVPTVEQYAQRLVVQGVVAQSEEYQGKVKQYQRRLEIMRRQRLTPDLPNWPAVCFYPMNKKRAPGENWFLLPLEQRERLMSEHGESGMKFAGKVTQLVTVGIGLDDWEWGVTLWARNPEFLKDIVYRMRFDEASARYAEFGPFFVGYQAAAYEILKHCGLSSRD
jgi:peroxiredoxin